MADREQSDKDNINPSSPQRKPHQNRAGSSYRGRGRANASVSKALHFFGVRDLREILDKKHQGQEQTTSGPPPDPSYNYLKDPAREYTNDQQTLRYHKEYPESRGHFSRGSRSRGRGGNTRENRYTESGKPSYIQNPVNIKVEVASTGERSCKIDEDTKLADIKHVPNYDLKDLRYPRHESNRGKGGPDRFDRGRGRGQRGGRRGRGVRGDRGGGRGQGRYFSPRNKENNQTQQQLAAPEVPSEENWELDIINLPNQNIEVENDAEKQEDELHPEEEYVEGQEEHEEFYEEDDGQYLETNEPDESPSHSGTNLEKNLVITSANNEERKRSVKFNVGEEQGDDATANPNRKAESVKEKQEKKETPKDENAETHETTSNNK